MASPFPKFTLHPAKPYDYPALTFLSLEAISRNPFFYLTFPPCVSPERISQHHFESKIQPPDDGSIEIIKIVDNSCLPTPRIVGFASWKIRRVKKKVRKELLPGGADPRFLEDFWRKAAPIVARFYNPDTDIELSVMRVLPQYQGRGVGGMLLRWGLEKAERLGKRVFLLSSPEGRYLYAKYGFKAVGIVNMDLKDYGAQGTYVQSAMIWSGTSRTCDEVML